MNKLTIIKVGGKIVEDRQRLQALLNDFAAIEGHKAIVHGGGKMATTIGDKMGIESKYVDGRRITDSETLDVVVMVYGGLVNKNLVAGLQARGVNALGLTGADLNIIEAEKRPVKTVDYGFAGDVKKVNAHILATLIAQNVVPVFAPLTHNQQGQMLNTNADTIASEVAKALSAHFDVSLIYCFEKAGVLLNENDDHSVIPHLDRTAYEAYKADRIIHSGMIPKLDNAFEAIEAGVKEVIIKMAENLGNQTGTTIR